MLTFKITATFITGHEEVHKLWILLAKISFSIKFFKAPNQTNPPLIVPHNLNYRPKQTSVNKKLQRRLSRELYC